MKIKFLDLVSQWNEIKCDVYKNLDSFFESSEYIFGPHLKSFEDNFSKWSGRKYSIGVSNATDGLKLAIQSFNFYDTTTDVIIPANGYIADALSVHYQTRGNFSIILPIHLYGHPTNMRKMCEISKKYNCKIIEDASHAHGAITNGEMVGKYADMTVYSLYPGKNLGAIGDAGIITTDSEIYRERLNSLRNYGSLKKYQYDDIGWNNRMDSIQALFLNEKLKKLDTWNYKKQHISKKYNSLLEGIVETPKVDDHVDLHVYHIYCIMVDNRENLQKFLESKGIPTIIHYPIPISESNPFKYLSGKFDIKKTIANCNRILSLPMHQYLNDSEIEYICDSIKTFYRF